MNSFYKTFLKIVRISVIAFTGVVIAGLEVKYPTIMGYTVFNGYTISVLIYALYDQIKHNFLKKLP